MDEAIIRLPVRRLDPNGVRDAEELVVREITFRIVLNGHPTTTLTASPLEPEELAVGHLAGQGIIRGPAEVTGITHEADGIAVHIAAETVKAVSPPVLTDLTPCWNATQISALVADFEKHSQLFRKTGGVHGAALAAADGIRHFSEDISRRHAIDKILGYCHRNEVATARHLLLTGGRVAADIVPRVARAGLPVIVSRSAPTDRAVALADRLGITLVGFARGQSMNVYSQPTRVVANSGASG